MPRSKQSSIKEAFELCKNPKKFSREKFHKALENALQEDSNILNAQDKKGNSLSHYCLLHGKEDFLQEISYQSIVRKINIEILINHKGESPLDLIFKRNKSADTARILINSTNIKDDILEKTQDLANKNNDLELSKFIEEILLYRLQEMAIPNQKFKNKDSSPLSKPRTRQSEL